MEEGEILLPEATQFRHHARKGIPQGQLERRAARGSQPKGVRLAEPPRIDPDVRTLSQSGRGDSGHGDHGSAEAPEIGEQFEHFPGFAAVAQEKPHVVPADHAEIPVGSLGGMEKESGRS
jgi:hypothetical protein